MNVAHFLASFIAIEFMDQQHILKTLDIIYCGHFMTQVSVYGGPSIKLK